MNTYDVTATVDGVDMTLIVSTPYFNRAIDAKNWAISQGYTSVVLHKFNH